MLIVFGGLPGTGKSTIAQALSIELRATYLRVDEIEHALRRQPQAAGSIGSAGYGVAQALARSNLRLGHWVVADSVNPVEESRSAWREVAAAAGVRLLEVELVCSNSTEHRRRVEGRAADIDRFPMPTWEDVSAHHYEPWERPHMVVDTATASVADTVASIRRIASDIGGTTPHSALDDDARGDLRSRAAGVDRSNGRTGGPTDYRWSRPTRVTAIERQVERASKAARAAKGGGSEDEVLPDLNEEEVK